MMFESIKRPVDKVLETLVILCMSALVVAVVWQVFSRYVLNDPSTTTDELSRYLMIHVGLLGAAYTTGLKRHLAIDLFSANMKGAPKLLADLLYHGVIAAFAAGIMIYGGYNLTMNTLRLGQVASSLGIKVGYLYIVIPVSGLFICFYSLLNIVETFKNHNNGSDNEVTQ